MKKLGSTLLSLLVLLSFPKISAKEFKIANGANSSFSITLPDEEGDKSQFRTRLLDACPQSIDNIKNLRLVRQGDYVTGVSPEENRLGPALPHAMTILTQILSIGSGMPISPYLTVNFYRAFGNNIIGYVAVLLGFLGLI